MILDKGIATLYHKTDTSGAGEMPAFSDVQFWQSWYGELSFETTPGRPTNVREEVRCDARVRVLQNRAITNHDRVELAETGGPVKTYEVIRAYHGRDDDSGELITDLSLSIYDCDDPLPPEPTPTDDPADEGGDDDDTG